MTSTLSRPKQARGRRFLRSLLPLLVAACATDEPLTQEEYDRRKEAMCVATCELEQTCDMPPSETLDECLAWCREDGVPPDVTTPCAVTLLEFYECAGEVKSCEEYDRLPDADVDPSAPCHEELQANETCLEMALNDEE
ncbi:MAG: hypothetical protein D6705_17785 [Deltaproteobacteria bacterium]|nr:MAG: hypothetical protein D6705_17785 [Deltaproteobacteria bacterium]